MSDFNFMARAICRDEDPELFFPVSDIGPSEKQIREAKTVCRRCPVVTECLAYALEHKVQGIWGGMTETERAAVVRGHRARKRRELAASA